MITLPQLKAPKAAPLRLPATFAPPSGAELRDRLAELRDRFGLRSLLTPPDANLKLAKGGAAAALTLAPADQSGLEVCPKRSPACSAACVLWNSGNGWRSSVRDARRARTLALAADPQAFLAGVVAEAWRMHRGADAIRALRLNCASDLLWERISGFLEALPPVAMFDYTKIRARISEDGQARGAARPYRLAYSISERSESVREAAEVLEANGTAVLVIAGLRRRQSDGTLAYHPMPREARIGGRWWPVVSGDRTDRRDLDPRGVIVALAGKGSLELPGAGGATVGERFAVAITSEDLRFRSPLRAAWRR